jgi:hypothetical protein
MVVSTDTPAAMAVTEAPAPRWQLTVRKASVGWPTNSAARRDA